MPRRCSNTSRIDVSLGSVARYFSAQAVSHTYTAQYDPLVQPALLRHEIVSSPAAQKTIASARYNAARILAGHDDRVLVIVGPCSIHSAEQAIEYAHLLKEKLPAWPNLSIIMRAYLYVFLCVSIFRECAHYIHLQQQRSKYTHYTATPVRCPNFCS
jgi:hypothetical protein